MRQHLHHLLHEVAEAGTRRQRVAQQARRDDGRSDVGNRRREELDAGSDGVGANREPGGRPLEQQQAVVVGVQLLLDAVDEALLVAVGADGGRAQQHGLEVGEDGRARERLDALDVGVGAAEVVLDKVVGEQRDRDHHRHVPARGHDDAHGLRQQHEHLIEQHRQRVWQLEVHRRDVLVEAVQDAAHGRHVVEGHRRVQHHVRQVVVQALRGHDAAGDEEADA